MPRQWSSEIEFVLKLLATRSDVRLHLIEDLKEAPDVLLGCMLGRELRVAGLNSLRVSIISNNSASSRSSNCLRTRGDRADGFLLTYVPSPWRASTRPSASRTWIASRKVGRLTLNFAASLARG